MVRFGWVISNHQMTPTHNPDLPFVKPDWHGNALDANGRFVNHEFPFVPSFKDVFKWKSTKPPEREEKKNDTFRLPVFQDTLFLDSDQDGIVWLGHATFFIRLGGFQLLTDPVFGSPSVLMKRFAQIPFDISQLKRLDYVLLSHDHRDHADEKSLNRVAKYHPDTQYLTGLNLKKLIHQNTKSTRIQEAGWYQRYQTSPGLEVVYLPARHWGRRYLTDTNTRLWGSFLIKAGGKSIYFGADSGYGSHFSEVKTLFGDIDVAILGIGAYKPEWFMHPSHTSPADAVRAFHDIGAKTMIPMHYGTFDLSDEPLGDPARSILSLEQSGQIKGNLKMLGVGEVFKW